MGKTKKQGDKERVEQPPAKKAKQHPPPEQGKEKEDPASQAAEPLSQPTQPLSQHIPKAKGSPRKGGASNAAAPVDLVRYGGERKLMKVTELSWGRDAKLGQTRQLDDNEVQVKIRSLMPNPPESL